MQYEAHIVKYNKFTMIAEKHSHSGYILRADVAKNEKKNKLKMNNIECEKSMNKRDSKYMCVLRVYSKYKCEGRKSIAQ